ncbi:hypothetical protein BTO06_09745 [Tenacibaculum sp. SZ-18]|nr:hypothetical protein BTO06_09745 [Tenacibaculum sp. SZ-18]
MFGFKRNKKKKIQLAEALSYNVLSYNYSSLMRLQPVLNRTDDENLIEDINAVIDQIQHVNKFIRETFKEELDLKRGKGKKEYFSTEERIKLLEFIYENKELKER